MKINILNKHKTFQKGEYIGRGSPLGNPFKIGPDGTREEVVAKYDDWLTDKINRQDPEIINELTRLYYIAEKGELNLICFCSPKLCHGEIIRRELHHAYNCS